MTMNSMNKGNKCSLSMNNKQTYNIIGHCGSSGLTSSSKIFSLIVLLL